jgi:hypothetical protein
MLAQRRNAFGVESSAEAGTPGGFPSTFAVVKNEAAHNVNYVLI